MERALKVIAGGALTALLCLQSLTALSGEVYYRWTDERGQPVHSDRPPPKGVDYEVISTGSTLKREVEAEEGAVPLEVKPSVSNRFDAVDEAKKRNQKNPEHCKTARENLEHLQNAPRVRARDDQGEFYYLDDEQRAAKIEENRKAADAFCE